jgi:hypothetical protein
MKIGLDWDGTVNADPKCFREIVCAFLDAGHEVKVTTWRCAPVIPGGWSDMVEIFESWGFFLPIVYCDGRAKRDCYEADIWIDDSPHAVIFSLQRAPRFESDHTKYYEDPMVCENEYGRIETTYGVITSKIGVKA